jgi:alpha-L-arabinofuranosidase
MRQSCLLSVLLFSLLSASVLPAEGPRQAAISVAVDQPGVKISPMLYGIFFEDINLSADGGIYPELVRNRSFEDSAKPEHWKLVCEGKAKAEMAIDTDRSRGQFDRRSLRLRVLPDSEGQVALVNEGYWGMAVTKGEQYELSVIARTGEGFDGPIAFNLESADGKKTYTKCLVGYMGADWIVCPKLTVTACETDPKARLAIRVSKPGVVWLDYVSLLPKKTWKGHGLRPDLCEMLAALKPAFVRFPGGCWVEGDKMELAYRWKTTIGDPSLRRTAWNIWAYQATNGLGHHEYLQLCEDLGAEPLFVINVGMAHRDNVPMEKMGEFVQDALDAIEYANGPADSKWGSLRAKAGHPAPFNMKYMEIGNENGGPAYQERYALFYDAIRAKYPEIKLVSDEPTRKRPSDIVDEHYYTSPEAFMGMADKYDRYDRKGPRIYVGEYAVTANCGQGNLAGAIGEAAFMTGMERNGDMVVMSSYAPLFVNVNHKRWNPDLIDFDSSRAYGIPSYYVQQMFAANRGDVVLPARVEVPSSNAPKTYPGGIGLGTWSTQAEYKDIKVAQGDKVLYTCDFAHGTEDWKTFGGQWKVVDGALRQSELKDDIKAIAGDKSWADYTYTLKARKLGGAEGFLVMFQVRDERNWLWWNIGGWGNRDHGIEQCQGGGKSPVGNHVAGRVETDRWYDVRIELKGPSIRCYLDGKLVHDVAYPQPKTLYAVAGRENSTGDVILKVVNASAEALDTRIELNGAKGLQPSAKATVLTSAKPTDENSITEPTKVAPKTLVVEGVGPNFRHTFPAHSVTVLRVKAGL